MQREIKKRGLLNFFFAHFS